MLLNGLLGYRRHYNVHASVYVLISLVRDSIDAYETQQFPVLHFYGPILLVLSRPKSEYLRRDLCLNF